ncbi:hypothetical protein [Flavivirga jejuensis]|uniref:Uncharacterized protein n=1 Tax=Flavivirga jejuensis TaxID=870487 RepID=A0ABT8WK47_9FLAO|nr:hypothetical protein [Flavivirga jejuensis]MDO5973531.1 hypothetical protein [Flavivirga jejuensis]
MKNSNNSFNSFGEEQSKYTEKVNQLRNHISDSPYVDVLEQPIICASFNLQYLFSNPKNWNNSNLLPSNNQLNLFDSE